MSTLMVTTEDTIQDVVCLLQESLRTKGIPATRYRKVDDSSRHVSLASICTISEPLIPTVVTWQPTSFDQFTLPQ